MFLVGKQGFRKYGAGDISQHLRALASLPEDPDLGPGPHLVAHNHL